MIKYIFITHVEFIEHQTDEFTAVYHCNYYCRVDEMLEELTMTELAAETPPKECKDLASNIQQLKLVSRFNPEKKYKMSIIVFDEDQESILADLLAQVDEQFGPTIKMIRKAGDSFDI